MKRVLALLGVVLLPLAACLGQGGAVPAAHATATDTSNYWHPAVQTLTDKNYDDVTLKTDGLAMVWFYKSGTAVNETGLLNALGPQTNRFKFFRVNRDESPQIWERFLSQQIRAEIKRGGTYHGNRRSVQESVLVLLLFCGKEFGEVASGAEIPPQEIEEILFRWIYEAGSNLNRRRRGGTENLKPIIPDRAIIPFFCEALVQMRMPTSCYVGGKYVFHLYDVWECMEQFQPGEQLAPLMPFLTAHLGGEYSPKACRILARVGEQAAPAVDLLMGLIQEAVSQVDAHPTVADAESEHRRESLQRATAAAYALGGIGPKASNAVPLLTRIAESEFQRMIFPQDRYSSIGRAKYGWHGSLGLQSAIALNRIVPPPTPGKNAVKYSGRTLQVFTQGHEDTLVTNVSIVFWNGRHCFEAQSDSNGTYSVSLPPGRYLFQHGHYLPSAEPDFEMSGREPEIIEVASNRQVTKDIAAEVVYVDYAHSAAYEVTLKDAPTNTVVTWVRDDDLKRIEATIEKLAGTRHFLAVTRAKGGRVVLQFHAFGPKSGADAAAELDRRMIAQLSTNTLLSVRRLPTAPNEQLEISQHHAKYKVRFKEVSASLKPNPREAVAAVIQPVLAGNGFSAHSRTPYAWRRGASGPDVSLSNKDDNMTWLEVMASGLEPAAWAERIDFELVKALDESGQFNVERIRGW